MTELARAQGHFGGGVLELPAEGPIDAAATATAAVLAFHPEGSLTPLFLLRTWETEVEMHRRLVRQLGAEQPVYSIAPPQGERVDDFPETPEAWTGFYLDRLRAVPHRGPYRLGGWSFGGAIAARVAEHLIDAGHRVELLTLLDTQLPKPYARHRTQRRKRTRLAKLARRLNDYVELETRRERLAYLGRRFGRRFQKLGRKLSDLPRRLVHGRDAVDRRHRERRRIAEGFGESDLSPLNRAIVVAYLKWERRPCAIPAVQLWTAESLERVGGDASLGWTACSRAELEMAPVPGTHWTMFDDPHVEVIGERLRRSLRRADEARARRAGDVA